MEEAERADAPSARCIAPGSASTGPCSRVRALAAAPPSAADRCENSSAVVQEGRIAKAGAGCWRREFSRAACSLGTRAAAGSCIDQCSGAKLGCPQELAAVLQEGATRRSWLPQGEPCQALTCARGTAQTAPGISGMMTGARMLSCRTAETEAAWRHSSSCFAKVQTFVTVSRLYPRPMGAVFGDT